MGAARFGRNPPRQSMQHLFSPLYCHSPLTTHYLYYDSTVPAPSGEQCQTQTSHQVRCSTIILTITFFSSTRNYQPTPIIGEPYRASILRPQEQVEIRVCRKYGRKITTTLTIRVRGIIQTKGCEKGLANILLHHNPSRGVYPSTKNTNLHLRDQHELTSDH